MKNALKRLVALALVMCSILSYAVPSANAFSFEDWWNENFGGGSNTSEEVNYDFDRYKDEYANVGTLTNASGTKTYKGVFYQALIGDLGTCSVDHIPNRFASGDMNWTYEAASAKVCGSTTELDYVPNVDSRFTSAYGFRSLVPENQWIALRIKSPGEGTYGMQLQYTAWSGSGTIAFYILPADGDASIDRTTVLNRRDAIQATKHPDNRVGTAKLSEVTGTLEKDDNYAVIGAYDFEADKEYILVMENLVASSGSGSAYLAISNLKMVPGELEDDSQTTSRDIATVTAQKNVVPATDNGSMAAVWEVDGHDYYFLPLEGGKMMIFDLDTWEPVKSVDTGIHYPTAVSVTNDGKMIVSGNTTKMFIFDINTMRGSLTSNFKEAGFEGSIESVYGADDSDIYFSTFPAGSIGRYNMEKKTYEYFADIIDPAVRQQFGITTEANDKGDVNGNVKGLAIHNGYFYARASSANYVVIAKYDIANMKLVGMLDVTAQLLKGAQKGISILGGKYLLAAADGDNTTLALVNLDKWSVVKENDSDYKALFKTSSAKNVWNNGASNTMLKAADGKLFFFGNSCGLFYYEESTQQIKRLHSSSNGNFNIMGNPTVTMDLSGTGTESEYLITFASGGEPRFYKTTVGSKIAKSEKLMKTEYGTGGSPVKLNTAHNNKLYIGAWNNFGAAVYDTTLEKISQRYYTAGQTDSQIVYKDQLYAGNYSATVVTKINMDVEEQTEFVISDIKKYQQERIHTLAAGNDHIFCGSIPKKLDWGGAVTAYDMNTKQQKFISFRCEAVSDEKTIGCTGATTGVHHPLCNLAVNGIVYEAENDVVLGATTRSGGTTVGYSAGTSAQIFVLDYHNMEILATLDLRNTNLGLDVTTIDYIGGLTIDPNVPGRVWGVVAETLFYFTYNKADNSFAVTKFLDLGRTFTTSSNANIFNRHVEFDTANNQMYVCLYGKGMQCITVKDLMAENVELVSNKVILTDNPEFYALSTDATGKMMLYYTAGNDLEAYPLNVDDADWAAAQVVDDMIAVIGAVTADKADDIAAARAAYEALPMRHKALVQNLVSLTEAEALVLEMQISNIIETPLINDLGAMGEFIIAYNNLTDTQKAYVRNFTTLETTYDAILNVAQTTNAGVVQDVINALPETAVPADKETVAKAREAYSALPDDLKVYVDTAKLENAESQIKEAIELAVGKVQDRINALPAEIVITDISYIKVVRGAFDALPEELKKNVDTAKLDKAEKALAELLKDTVPTQQVYNFELYDNAKFYTDSGIAYDDTGVTADFHAGSTYSKTSYATVADWFYGNYPQNINWGVETNNSGAMSKFVFRGATDQGMRLTDTLTEGTYSTLRIFVPAAGLYQVDLQAGDYKSTFSMYVIPASTLYAEDQTSASAITAAMTAENQLFGKTVFGIDATATVGQWNVAEPGDYILIFKAEATNGKGVNLRNMTLTPVVDETTASAVVGENYFLSLSDAFAYQVETGAEAVLLNKDTVAGDLVLQSSAVLDLNGKTLTADSVLTYASSGIIDSSELDTGVLKIKDADGNMLSNSNAQLPIYDAAAEGYRFFEVSVDAIAITGKNGGNAKYWFKVNVVNFEEVHKLIDAGSKLDIGVKMTANGVEADAVAGEAFLAAWADKYAVGDSFYITVTTVNAEGVEDFVLIPCMTANGVAICGEEMK